MWELGDNTDDVRTFVNLKRSEKQCLSPTSGGQTGIDSVNLLALLRARAPSGVQKSSFRGFELDKRPHIVHNLTCLAIQVRLISRKSLLSKRFNACFVSVSEYYSLK